MNFWTGKQDDKEFEKERNRILKEWEELHQKRMQQKAVEELTRSAQREGWYD